MANTQLDQKLEEQAAEAVDWRVRLSERVRVTARTTGVGVWEWNLIHRTFTFDERTYELFGLAAGDEKLDLSVIFRCVHPQDRMRLAEDLQRASNGLAELDVKFRVNSFAGRPRHLHAQAELIDHGRGLSARLVGTLRDVTSSQKLSEALAEERERLQVTLNAIGDAVVATDVDGIVTFVNPPAAAMTRWASEEAIGRPLGEVLNVGPERTDPALIDAVNHCLEDETVPQVRNNARLLNRGGSRYMVETTASTIRSPLGEIMGAVLVLRDTTEAQDFQRRLRHAATHDPLTDLANRTLFEEALNQAAASATDGGEHALFFIDVDRFKVINDSAGHNAGDMFLKALVDVLRSVLRDNDLLARLGGDEFGLILRDTSPAEAERLAGDMVRAAKDYRFAWEGRVYSAGVSVGVTRIVPGATGIELLGQADSACYAAKNAGRGRATVFQSGSSTTKRQEIVVAADLRKVIEENRLVLFAQEIVAVDPAQRARRKYEVLVRMLDRQYALVGPGAFIPAAERFSIMDEVDDWILREAIQNFGRRIALLGSVEVSLNLSANSLDNPTLLQFVMDLLEESPLPPAAITFEITESAALSQVSTASRVMAGLKDLGCKVALDDFGIGSSSLSYLKHFPVDFVKLDGSFIQNMLTSEVDYAIVSSINDLAHRIGAKTVAEFVEDEATVAAVTSIGVDYIQGYIFGTPRPLDQILKGLSPG